MLSYDKVHSLAGKHRKQGRRCLALSKGKINACYHVCIIKQAVFMYITYFSIELKEGVCYRQRETSRFVRNK